PTQVLPMYQTGDVWHRFEAGLPSGTQYLYRAEGPYTPEVDGSRFNSAKVLIDPEALAITGDNPMNAANELGYDNSNPSDPLRDRIPSKIDNVQAMPRAIALANDFDWGDDKPPAVPMQDAIIYELNVRGFTADAPELGPLQGTYRGLMAKLPYLKDLGVTTVELMPIFKFDRADSNRVSPITGEQLYNAWGYNTTAYKAPEGRLAADGSLGEQVNEFKSLVKAAHDLDMEVVLDVVYNHTREGDQHGPTYNFKGLDNKTYYMLNPNSPDQYVDHTGCGNTMNTNDPVVRQYIVNSLKYWVQEMHVDGFRFDLAPIFKYLPDGSQVPDPPIMQDIKNDPVLSQVKLIAEPWSIDQYYLGKFADTLWSEWNGSYRDTVRKFLKSDSGQTGTLADRVDGSPSMFDESKGRNSVNFVTAHDGFTMRDLVSYNEKHNLANGEENRDGSNDNFSWNSGHEGEVDDAPLTEEQKTAIEQLRERQQKNMMAILMLSRGTPMMLYGDEIRRTQMGNNNAYNQEHLIEMPWDQFADNQDMYDFTRGMIDLRKTHNIGRVDPDSVVWHGTEVGKPDFSDQSRILSWQISPPNAKPLYIAFNAHWDPKEFKLPEGNWRRLMDTNLPPGQDVMPSDKAPQISGNSYWVNGRSAIVLEAQ
ncbi:MAG TPA: alpha-amylase family glycosyl hydrolase, partial [Chroococcales cyanobacterium]